MRRLLITLVVAGSIAACSDDSAPAPASVTESEVLEVFSYYRGEDAAAFRKVLDRFEESTGYEVVHVGTADLARRLTERVDDSDPPDVALLAQPGLIRELAEQGDLYSVKSISPPLDDEVAAQYDGTLQALTVDGEVFAIPWRIDVTSLIWYRPDVFEEWEYAVPRSLGELEALVSQMGADGFVPWCISIESFDATGWVGTDWIEDIVIRQQGIDFYDRWAAGDVPFDSRPVRAAFSTWGDLALAPGRHFGTTRTILNTPWAEAANPMLESDPGCLLHRQVGAWANELPGELAIGTDVDVFPVPPNAAGEVDPILVNGEFATALTADAGVAELMAFLLDPGSGAIWAQEGGYVSPHPSFDPANYSSELDRRLDEFIEAADVVRFDGSDSMPSSVGTGTFWTGVTEFVASRDLDLAVSIVDSGFEAEDPAADPS